MYQYPRFCAQNRPWTATLEVGLRQESLGLGRRGFGIIPGRPLMSLLRHFTPPFGHLWEFAQHVLYLISIQRSLKQYTIPLKPLSKS